MYSFQRQNIAALKDAKNALIAKTLALAREHKLFIAEKLNFMAIEDLVALYDALSEHVKKQLHALNEVQRRLKTKTKRKSAKGAASPPQPRKRSVPLPQRVEVGPEVTESSLPISEIVINEDERPLFSVIATSTEYCQPFEEVEPQGSGPVQNLLKLARMAFLEEPTATILQVNELDAPVFLQ